MNRRQNRSGGSGGGGGYRYQAQAYALIAAKIIAESPLVNWVDTGCDLIPTVILQETGRGGDDIQIVLRSGKIIELQAKSGLKRKEHLWAALIELAEAVIKSHETYCVLLTDTNASKIVRDALRSDIERIGLGREDDLKEIGVEFINRLRDRGFHPQTVCSRLRIVVRDFGTASHGETETYSALSSVVSDVAEVGSAYSCLFDDGMELIKYRGRRDAGGILRKLTQRGIRFSGVTESSVALQKAFVDWAIYNSCLIHVPSLNVALPISRAWMNLRVVDPGQVQYAGEQSFEQQVQQYRDWHRLAEIPKDVKVVGVEEVLRSHRRIVITGGAGAGKSTLLRRLAHLWSQKDNLVLRVPLRTVALRMDDGETFEEATYVVAAQGFPSSSSRLSSMLRTATILLADGLDETDTQRASVAEELCRWASADPLRRVVVTTRPVGHNPAWFSNWHHYELLPLRQDDIEEFTHIICHLLHPNDATTAVANAEQFLGKLRSSRTASVAARSPQLLGFLIALHLKDHPLEGNRYDLFQSIIDQMADYVTKDRAYHIKVDETVTNYVFDSVGWMLLERPFMTIRELRQNIGNQLAQAFDRPIPRGMQEAGNALGFLEERGLIERIGTLDRAAYMFLHQGFQEFAATRFAAAMPEDLFKQFIRNCRHKAQYHEVLLMTGATQYLSLTVNTLLQNANADDPISIDGLLAADVLAEATDPPNEVHEAVYAYLRPRLTSNFPLVAYEAAESLIPLIPLIRNAIHRLAPELTLDPRLWVKEIGCLLGLFAGADYKVEETLVRLYPELNDAHFYGPGWQRRAAAHNTVHYRLLIEGAQYLVKAGYANLVKTKIIRRNMSGLASDAILKTLSRHLAPDDIMELRRKLYGSLEESFRNLGKLVVHVKVALINYAQSASISLRNGSVPPKLPPPDENFRSLIVLYHTISIEQSTGGDLWLLKKFPNSVTEVVKGAILVAELDPLQILADTEYARTLLEKSEQEFSRRISFHDVNPSNDMEALAPEPNWRLASESSLDVELLFEAVDHPTDVIRHFATLLLVNCMDIDLVSSGFQRKLYTDSVETLRIVAYVAEHVWGDEAGGLMLERLESGFADCCSPLVAALGKLRIRGDNVPRVLPILRRSLNSSSEEMVRAAIEASEKLKMQSQLVIELRAAYEWWLHSGPPYPKGGGIVPPNPAALLFELLVSLGRLDYNDLHDAANTPRRGDVNDVAVTALSKYMQADADSFRRVIKDIGSGGLPASIMSALSKSNPEFCCQHTNDFVALLDSESSDVRLHCIRVLGAGWASPDLVDKALRPLLAVQEPDVRDEAIRSLRSASGMGNRPC